MLPILYVEVIIVALSSILVSDVYSQAQDCGIVSKASDKSTNAEGAWPWMVAITKKERDGHYVLLCSGFLIDRRHLLTAAHCFGIKYDVHDFLIRIGKKNQDEEEEYEIACITIHPRYRHSQLYSDIAIVTLSREVDTPNYTPICLPDEELTSDRVDGIVVTKTAWEHISPVGIQNKSLVQVSGIRIISNRECNIRFMQQFPNFRRALPYGVNSGMLCTLQPKGERNLCEGYSGGPLMYKDNKNRWIVVGIISFGAGVCGNGSPDGYTRVSSYLIWIMKNTGDKKDNCS